MPDDLTTILAQLVQSLPEEEFRRKNPFQGPFVDPQTGQFTEFGVTEDENGIFIVPFGGDPERFFGTQFDEVIRDLIQPERPRRPSKKEISPNSDKLAL